MMAVEVDGEAFRSDPFPVWKRLRDTSPAYRDERTGQWVLTRYGDVVAAFADSARLSNRPYTETLGAVFGPTMLSMDGAAHALRRRMVMPQMVGRRLAGFLPVVRRAAAELVEEFASDGEVDLVREFSSRLPVRVIVDMLGLPREDHGLFSEWYAAMMAGLGSDPRLRADGVRAHSALSEYLRPLVAARLREPTDDLLSGVVHAEVAGRRLEGTEIAAFVSLLLTAGGETTDKAITNLWWNLLQLPEQLAAVRADPGLLEAAFSETMRHSFPVIGQVREVVAPTTVAGVDLDPGARITLSIGSANNDERVFADPRRFDPRRSDLHLAKELRFGQASDPGRHGHVGFGLGRHFCLGYELARAEAVIGSSLLLAAMAAPEPADPPTPLRIVGVTRSVSALRVRFTPVADRPSRAVLGATA